MKNYEKLYEKGLEYTQEALQNWDKRRSHLINYYSQNQVFSNPLMKKARVLTAILWLDMRVNTCIISLEDFGSKRNQEAPNV